MDTSIAKLAEKIYTDSATMIEVLSIAYLIIPCTGGERHYLYIGNDDEYHLQVWIAGKGEWIEVLMDDVHDPVLTLQELAKDN